LNLKNTPEHYGFITKSFHWVIAFCMILMIFLGFFMHPLMHVTGIDIRWIHKALGLTLLLLGILFNLWRIFTKKPPYLSSMKRWEEIAATASHHSLLTLIILMPLSGLIMSSYAGHLPSFWGLFTVGLPVTINPQIAHTFGEIHEILGIILSAVIVIHLLAVIRHHFFLKDNTLGRMR
jgi:cytochrome b561